MCDILLYRMHCSYRSGKTGKKLRNLIGQGSQGKCRITWKVRENENLFMSVTPELFVNQIL